MKWLKHRTDSRRQLFIKNIIRALGHKFAFVWYCVVEIIAERYRSEGDSFAVTLHLSDWLSETNLHPNAKERFIKLIELASSHRKVNFELLDSNLKVELLEVFEIADEYARKIRSKSVEDPVQRRVKEIKRKETSLSELVGQMEIETSKNTSTLPKGEAKSSKAWESYSKAMLKVHGATPPRNKKINSLLCKIVDRVGEENAVQLVSYFVNHQNGFYRSRGHQLDFALRDAESLLLEIRKGRPNDTYIPASGVSSARSIRTNLERSKHVGEIDAFMTIGSDNPEGESK